MCTAFIKKGNDILYGYNLDVDPAVWNYRVVKRKGLFSIGIKVGSTLYLTHGVNSLGNFGNLPYMNGPVSEKAVRPKGYHRLDLLNDRYIKGTYSYDAVHEIVTTCPVVNIANASMHSLIGDAKGHMLLVEPGFGWKELEGDFAVVTNFPVLTELKDYSNPFFGYERYCKTVQMLSETGSDFGVSDALAVLRLACQGGQWGTRVSFVYSQNENAVYFVMDRDFGNVQRWQLS